MTPSQIVVIGADTHLDTIHLAALSETGKPLGDAEFPTRPSGYYVAVKWAQSFGTVTLAGVEGTNSYGAGLTRALQDGGIDVVEVNRPTALRADAAASPTHWMPTPQPARRCPGTDWLPLKTNAP